MAGISSLGIAVSGLNAAQAGLSVTGHNMSNVYTVGYSRQRILQSDFIYGNVGSNNTGLLQVGLGTNVQGIYQIRDKFLDVSYRKEVSRQNFYAALAVTGSEAENIIGELQSDYRAQSVFQDLWDSLNELSMDPSSLAARGTFITSATKFIDKINNVADRLYEYQLNLNEQIKSDVTRTNQLLNTIYELNGKISQQEMSGDHANDYRDSRNAALDELGQLLDIEFKELPNGTINVQCGGHELIAGLSVSYIGLKYVSGGSHFVEPIITYQKGVILPADTPPDNYTALFNYNQTFNANNSNDYGKIKGLILARGMFTANYTSMLSGFDDKTAVKADIFLTALTVTGGAAPTEYEAAYNAYLAEVATYNGVDTVAGSFAAYKKAYNEYLVKLKEANGNDISLKAPSAPTIPMPPNPADYAGGTFADYDAILNAYNGYMTVYGDNYNKAYEEYSEEYSVYSALYTKEVFDNKQGMIPKIQRELDTMINAVVTTINNYFAPVNDDGKKDLDTAPYDLNKNQSFEEIFVRKNLDRFTGDDFNEESSDNYGTLYTMGNLMINPKFSTTDGYNLLATSKDMESISDNTLILDIMAEWKDKFITMVPDADAEKFTLDDAYNFFVTNIGTETNKNISYYAYQEGLAQQIDNERAQVQGVSLDEEMRNMMVYQHAYNASSRILNAIDQMLDRIINNT